MNRSFTRYVLLSLVALFTIGFVPKVQAQDHSNKFIITAQQGSDSSQSVFAQNSRMYMYVFTKNLNVQNMKKAEWEISKSGHNDGQYHFQGQFVNHFDSTFSAEFDLSMLPMGGAWKWKAKLKDNNDHEAEFETVFYYKETMGDSSMGDDMDMEMEGVIQSVGQNQLRVNNFTFSVNEQTQIEKDDHSIGFSDLKIGDFVKIKAQRRQGDSWLALKIEVKNRMEHDNYTIKIKGFITSLNDTSIAVNGHSILLNEQTVIEGKDDQPLSVSDLQVGMFVKIEARVLDSGQYVALKIEVKQDENHEVMDFEIRGIIDSVGTDYIVVVGQHIRVSAQTEIEVNDNEHASIGDLQTGMFVKIKLYMMNNGTFIADKIEVKNENFMMQRIRIVGAIDSLGNDFLMVEGYTVYTDSNTVILNDDFQPITLLDLRKGQIVKIKGIVQNDGTVLADRIKVRDLWMAYFKIEGTIESVAANSVSVEGMTFTIDSATVILDADGNPVSADYLTVGQEVHIKARQLQDGSYLALRIKIEQEDPASFDITGAIQLMTSDSITVNDVRFYVNAKSEIYDLQDNRVTLDSLSIGQIVEVKGRILNDGTYYARKIEVEEDPNMMNLSSTLEGKSSASIFIGGKEYRLSSKTVVLDSNYNEINVDQLSLGSDVTVWALTSDNGNLEAVQVQTNATTGVTAVANRNAPSIIQSFDLKQNYPNPFNPTTTIEFVLNHGQFANVRLDVFNMLGQKVRTLFNGVLSAGTYKFQWNGQNDAAARVASGMYLYRLEVNGKAKVKQMLLIK